VSFFAVDAAPQVVAPKAQKGRSGTRAYFSSIRQGENTMNILFMADVERQVYRDWQDRFNKRVVRRSTETSVDHHQPVQSLVDRLKEIF
jgi:hypothetical protein